MSKGFFRSKINGTAVTVTYRYTLGKKTRETFNELLIKERGNKNEKNCKKIDAV
jgi:hypothetical protein